MAGFGQYAGKSLACSSIAATAVVGVAVLISFSGFHEYLMILTDYAAIESELALGWRKKAILGNDYGSSVQCGALPLSHN